MDHGPWSFRIVHFRYVYFRTVKIRIVKLRYVKDRHPKCTRWHGRFKLSYAVRPRSFTFLRLHITRSCERAHARIHVD